MPERNDATWNTVISGLFKANMLEKGMDLFRKMRENGFSPNGFVLTNIITKGVDVHSLVLKLGLVSDVYVGTALLHLYGKCGFIEEAQRTFEEMSENNVVSWTALMVSYSLTGSPEEAIKAYSKMRTQGVDCNENSFATVISSCALMENEKLSLEILAHAIVSGFETVVSVANSLVNLFGKLGNVKDAEYFFDRIRLKDIISWNSILTVYSHEGMCEESLHCFTKMRKADVNFDYTTLCCLISACNSSIYLKWGKGLHALSLKKGLISSASVSNTLIAMYSQSGRMKDAEQVYYEMSKRDLISYNNMLSSYTLNGCEDEAMLFFSQLHQVNMEMNHVTYANALSACTKPGSLLDGKVIHGLVIHNGLFANLLLGNSLITMYSKCNAMREAEVVFHFMPIRDLISWNTLISGHVDNDEHIKAVQTFILMRKNGTKGNYITIVNILGSCSAPNTLMSYGKPLHSLTIVTGLDSNEVIKNALITMYAKCSDFDSSVCIFDGLERKSDVSWNALISSKARHGQGEDALKLFMKMRHDGINLDQFNLSGAFAATASLSSLEEGQQLHCLVTKSGFDFDIHVLNAAIDMYSKCGKLDDMLKLLPDPINRSRISWNTIISGYARHGLLQKAEDTFKEMLSVGTKPDYVTFVALLSSFSHGGLVDKGMEYYKLMQSEFGIAPRVEHCVCIVDLLGRAGLLHEAENAITDMPFEADSNIWGALLGACKLHGNLEMGRRAAERLFVLKPEHHGYYALISNMYAEVGRWEEAKGIRDMMRFKKAKNPGYSWGTV